MHSGFERHQCSCTAGGEASTAETYRVVEIASIAVMKPTFILLRSVKASLESQRACPRVTDSTLNFTVRRAHEAVNRDAVLRTWGEGGC
ncbi:hypothetical protein LMH87_010655 [Akanthomyces muscarius]|uniref:Uncharacterized protein n=1 Tax=Akanthomyces muscarius TaxID=2231603 RepID=A0A9W8Q7N9_AKAMU|nr:hypothetical protein LMH87_010655 [Akanthomyces muscarius]KAJ4149877.1 hypothetical protein LMH87_010655 [Akanthomyces muscarius]